MKPVRDRFCNAFQVERKSFSHKLGKGIVTFILIDISWVFFRANSMTDAFTILWKMIFQWNPWILTGKHLFKLGIDSKQFHMILAALLVLNITDICKYLKIDVIRGICTQGVWLRYVVYLIIIFWILLCGSYGFGYDASQFIYFQF